MKNKIKVLLMCTVIGSSSLIVGCSNVSDMKEGLEAISPENEDRFKYDYVKSFEAGEAYFEQGNYQLAMVEYRKAIEEYTGNNEELDVIQHRLGECYYGVGEYEIAIPIFEESIETRKSYGEKNSDIFISYIAISNCYLMLEDYDKALEYALISLDEYHKTEDKYETDESYIFERLSTIYYWRGDYDNSISYANQVIDYDTSNLLDEEQYEIDVVYSYSNIADCYYDRGEYQTAADTYEQAKTVCIEYGDYYSAGYMGYYEADAYEMLGDLEKTREILKETISTTEGAINSGYDGDLEYILEILNEYMLYLDEMEG